MRKKLSRFIGLKLDAIFGANRSFSSKNYWKSRYASGGNSGSGSYEHLAIFKAEMLNAFISENLCSSVIEFGCGDGNQLRYAKYPAYMGYDVSPNAIAACRKMFSGDASKHFDLVERYDGRSSDISLSLDVIFHLVEDEIFDGYMRRLFDASHQFVAIYSSDSDESLGVSAPHVKHRRFTRWIADNRRQWNLIRKIDNQFPFDGDHQRTTFSNFFFYANQSNRE